MTTTTTTQQARRVRLELVDVPRPCPADWAAMAAIYGDRVRHCQHCDKDVYNLSALPRAAAEQFMADQLASVAAGGEHACVRLYKRADGTAVTADCGGRWRVAAGRRVARWGGAVGAVASVVLAVVSGRGSRAQTTSLMGTSPGPPPTSDPATSQPATRPMPVLGRFGMDRLPKPGPTSEPTTRPEPPPG